MGRTGVHRLGSACLNDTYTLLCCTSLSTNTSMRGCSCGTSSCLQRAAHGVGREAQAPEQ